MEFKIVSLAWSDSYAVMSRTGSSGWRYIAKYISLQEAEQLLKEVTP